MHHHPLQLGDVAGLQLLHAAVVEDVRDEFASEQLLSRRQLVELSKPGMSEGLRFGERGQTLPLLPVGRRAERRGGKVHSGTQLMVCG